MLISDTELSREIAKLRGWVEISLGNAGMAWEKPNGGIAAPINIVQHWQDLSTWLAAQGLSPSVQHIQTFWSASVKRNEDYFTAYDADPGRALALATCQAFGIAIEHSQQLIVTMPDGSQWAVPVEVIARHRAQARAAVYGGDVERALQDDTLFTDYPDEIHDWAANNMRWDDVKANATRITKPAPVDYAEGWANGEWEVRIVER